MLGTAARAARTATKDERSIIGKNRYKGMGCCKERLFVYEGGPGSEHRGNGWRCERLWEKPATAEQTSRSTWAVSAGLGCGRRARPSPIFVAPRTSLRSMWWNDWESACELRRPNV